MLAWESHYHAIRWLHDSSAPQPRPHLLPFVKTGLITAGFVNRGEMQGLASTFRGAKPKGVLNSAIWPKTRPLRAGRSISSGPWSKLASRERGGRTMTDGGAY